jgi:cyanophycinase
MAGTLALVGGAEWHAGCDFDQDLLAESGGKEVVVLPTAAAYEHPDRAIEAATSWFADLGATVVPVRVLTRADALGEEAASTIRAARFLYLADGSPMHLRSVLKDSPAWTAVLEAWEGGAVLAGSGSSAMALCDPMVDPRGGALTLGLGAVTQMAVIPHHNAWSEDKEKRTLKIAPAGMPIAGIDERTALLRAGDGSWRVAGAGEVTIFQHGEATGLDVLP